MDFVDQREVTVQQAELVLGVHQDQALFGQKARAALEQPQGDLPHLRIAFGRGPALRNDFGGADFAVVLLLGRRGDQRLRKARVGRQPVRHGGAAERARARRVGAAHGPRQIAPHHHLDADRFDFAHERRHRIDGTEHVVGHEVGRFFEPPVRQAAEHFALQGNRRVQHAVEGRQTVADDQQAGLGVHAQAVADLAAVKRLELGRGGGFEHVHGRFLRMWSTTLRKRRKPSPSSFPPAASRRRAQSGWL